MGPPLRVALLLCCGRLCSTLSMATLTPRLILGSGSPTRKAILGEMGIRFNVMTADIDERAIGERALDAAAADDDADSAATWGGDVAVARAASLVTAIAHAKADALLDRIAAAADDDGGAAGATSSGGGGAPSLLLCCDQVVLGGAPLRVLEKPRDAAEAREMLAAHSAGACRTVGAAVLADTSRPRAPRAERWAGVDVATISFGPFPDGLADELIAEGAVFGCAGGLMVEHALVAPHVRRVDGALDSVMGLCKTRVRGLLAEAAAAGAGDAALLAEAAASGAGDAAGAEGTAN